MVDFRTLLVVATVSGFLITVVGLVLAYLGALTESRDADRRVAKMKELEEAERTEHVPDTEGLFRVVEANARWDAIYAAHGLTRPTRGNTVYLAAYESRRLLGLVLNSTRRDFLVAAFGLLISTVASVGSLSLPPT